MIVPYSANAAFVLSFLLFALLFALAAWRRRGPS